jgi:hypothetical protein
VNAKSRKLFGAVEAAAVRRQNKMAHSALLLREPTDRERLGVFRGTAATNEEQGFHPSTESAARSKGSAAMPAMISSIGSIFAGSMLTGGSGAFKTAIPSG